LDGVHQRGDALQGVVLALDGYQHAVRRHQGVEGEQSQGGRAVDKQIVVLVPQGGQRVLELVLTALQIHQFQLGSGQADVRRQQRQALHLGAQQRLFGVPPADDHFVYRSRISSHLQAKAAGGVALGVHIHHQHPLALGSNAGAEVHGGGCFAHPALLVCDGNDLAHVLYSFLSGYQHTQQIGAQNHPSSLYGIRRLFRKPILVCL